MRLFLFITLIGMISCSGSRKNENGVNDSTQNKELKIDSILNTDTIHIGSKIFHIDSIDETEFKRLKPATDFLFEEGKNLINDSASVKRIEDSLILNLSNGKKASFVNTKGEGYSSYRYFCRAKEINHFVVMGIYDEWHEYILVNETNGDSTYVCGIPVVSPNKKFVICGNYDMVGFSMNGFDFFEIENNNALKKIGRKEYEFIQGPKTLKWKSNREIFAEIGYDVENKGKVKYIKMRFD